MKKKISVIFALISLCMSFCFAGQISVQIVQHNLPMDYVTDQSLIVEDELLNGFFEQGFIVTNSVASVSVDEETDADLLHTGFGEAYDGSSDYFVQVKLFFDPPRTGRATDVSPCRLDHVDWIMMKVKSGETIKESSIKGSDKKSDLNDNIRLTSRTLISEIKKAL